MYETHVVPGFGGGLRFDSHPAFIPDDTWSWCNAVLPRFGTAEFCTAYQDTGIGAAAGALGAHQFLVDVAPAGTSATSAANGEVFVLVGWDQAPTSANEAAQVWLLNLSTGGVTKIKPDTWLTSPRATLDFTAPSGSSVAWLNGGWLGTFGSCPSSSTSLVRWVDGASTYSQVASLSTYTAFQPTYLTTAVGRVVAARLMNMTAPSTAMFLRTVAWSDANVATTWDPAISNSADNVTLEALGGIAGMNRRGDGLLTVLTPHGHHVMVPTGGIPAFTIQESIGQGLRLSPANLCAATPYGLCWVGYDDVYLDGRPIGGAIFPYYAKSSTGSATLHAMMWHPRLRSVIVPTTNTASSTSNEFLIGDPVTQTWTRRVIPWGGAADPWRRHTVATTPLTTTHVVVSAAMRVYLDTVTLSAPDTTAFVDTKDFAFDLPMAEDYVDRIKVDVEPLHTAATDAITVKAAVHNDMSRQSAGVLGSTGFETQNLTFTTLGTLTGGVGELPVRLRGKYIRFRFQQSSGTVRIRGFSIRRQRASDKKVS